jgi:predicted nucleic acid-binding protein
MVDRFVIDNSVVMSWCFQDETNRYADAVLDRLSESTAVVPYIWALEVVNVLLVAERHRRLRRADSVRFITLVLQLPITIDHESPGERMKDLLALGRSSGLSAYDAAYLDLAIREGCPIATLDKKLVEAAERLEVTILDL